MNNWLFEEASPEIVAMADAALADHVASIPRDAEFARQARAEFGGRKFNGGDMAGHLGGDLYTAACEWLKSSEALKHSLPFVRDIAAKYARGGGLSDAQAAGILNCMTARRPSPIAGTMVVEGGGEAVLSKLVPDADDTSYDAWLCIQASAVEQGYYTVVTPERRVTIRVGKWKDDLRRPGEIMRWVSYLSGSDNTSDYSVFAMQRGDGTHRIMPAYRSSHGYLNTALNILLHGGSKDAALEYALESKRCARCNRLLTVPASVYAGYGPECVKHVGG